MKDVPSRGLRVNLIFGHKRDASSKNDGFRRVCCTKSYKARAQTLPPQMSSRDRKSAERSQRVDEEVPASFERLISQSSHLFDTIEPHACIYRVTCFSRLLLKEGAAGGKIENS